MRIVAIYEMLLSEATVDSDAYHSGAARSFEHLAQGLLSVDCSPLEIKPSSFWPGSQTSHAILPSVPHAYDPNSLTWTEDSSVLALKCASMVCRCIVAWVSV